VEEHYN